MKTIVTHLSPDLDSITSCWLIKYFLPGWKEAEIKFVPAGSTLENKPPDGNPDIIHLDTGMGKFDHHQKNDYTSATKLVFEFLSEKKDFNLKVKKPLERIINFVNDIDHFAEVDFPSPTSDVYDFSLHQIIEGLKPTLGNDQKLMEVGFTMLNAILQIFRNKVRAEVDIKHGFVFHSSFGRSIVMETKNEEATKLALKMGFNLVGRKDPLRGNIRIKTRPDKCLDLSPLYKQILKVDKKGTWFFHISKNMLLNASSKNPNFIPSSISTQQLIEIIKKI